MLSGKLQQWSLSWQDILSGMKVWQQFHEKCNEAELAWKMKNGRWHNTSVFRYKSAMQLDYNDCHQQFMNQMDQRLCNAFITIANKVIFFVALIMLRPYTVNTEVFLMEYFWDNHFLSSMSVFMLFTDTRRQSLCYSYNGYLSLCQYSQTWQFVALHIRHAYKTLWPFQFLAFSFLWPFWTLAVLVWPCSRSGLLLAALVTAILVVPCYQLLSVMNHTLRCFVMLESNAFLTALS